MKPVILVALALVFVVSGSVLAETASDKPANTGTGLVNLEMKDVPVKQAIDKLFEGRGLGYIIEPGVTGKVVQLKLKGLTLDEALTELGKAAGFTYRIENGTYVICPSKTGANVAEMPGERKESYEGARAPRVNVGPVASPSTEIDVNVPLTPVFIGSPGGYGGGYGGFGYPPVYQVGNTSVVGGYYPPIVVGQQPYVFGRFPMPPPPPGWVPPDVERLLRFQWAVRSVPGFITPYPYY